MNQGQQLHVGDRISTKYPLHQLPAGSYGTIHSVFFTARGVYDVLFDSEQTLRIVFQPDVKLISSEMHTATV